MSSPDSFEMQYNSVRMQVRRLQIAGYLAFRVEFSSARAPIVVARATTANATRFWTSIPEGRQREAEGVGKLIEAYFKEHPID